MSLEMKKNLVLLFFFVLTAILLYFFIKRLGHNKKQQAKAMQVYNEKKDKYTYLKPGTFDECPSEDISAAALFHCMRKEQEDFDHYFENMNHSERVIYGIYQATSTIDGPNASLHSFFLSPSNDDFIDVIDSYFEEVGSHDLADLMRAARRFAEIIENDEEDDEDDEVMGIYSRYNFSDFTNEFVTLVGSTNLAEKLTQYILDHKDDFYDVEDEENGEDKDERISDEV